MADVTELEKDFAQPKVKFDGVALHAFHQGHLGSSTRAELMGAIVAALAPMPLHLALDNNTVVQKAKYLIQRAIDLGETAWD
eukprot:2799125-Karenia_brevis.AAC.1